MGEIAVACERVADGWLVRVTVQGGGPARNYLVTVSQPELARLDPGSADPSDLVRRSFEFLLAREPKESILASFGLSVIGRYFPEYEAEIRRT